MRKFVFGGSYLSFTPDPDALAYFAANSAITSDADKLAIDAFYKGLKADGIYTKIKAMYLPKWGAAANDKWNLKDPRDLDVAFRLSFQGGWTFSTNGATPNGTNAYADTYFTASSYQALSSGHFSIYSRTSIASSSAFGANGVRDVSGVGTQLIMRRADNLRAAIMYSEGTGGVVVAANETDARGLYLISRTSTTLLKFFKNAVSLGSNTNTHSTSLSFYQYYLSAISQANSPLASTYDNKQIAFSSIGDGLSDAESTALYNRVQTLMTYFGINV